MDVSSRIRAFVEEEILVDGDVAVADDTLLLNGAMDSMGLMRLVAFLEEEFDVEIDDAEITEDNFRTVRDIARLVEESRGAA